MTGPLLSLLSLCLAALCSYAAWALAALALPAHWHAAGLRRRQPRATLMRAGACMLGAAAAGLCVARDGWAMGVLLWACMACVAAVSVVLTLAWLHRPRD